jgi:DNA invertase Pin-like site-specific DNA recombinase
LVVARISTVHQDKRSNEDQVALCRRWVADRLDGDVRWEAIASRISGAFLDGRALADAEARVESDELDLVIVEDLGRICRRHRALDFCDLCEDHGVRLIAINDDIDTAREHWKLNAFFAALRHQLYNHDTAARIRRSLRHRFTQGGVFQCPIYGYLKTPGSKRDQDVVKDKAAEQVYSEWFRMLEGGASYAEVADWLNRGDIKPGPYCRQKVWTGRMVRRVTFNPILKGCRLRNVKETKRVNSSGHSRSVDAPPEMLLRRDCPNLRFIEPDRYDRVISMLRTKNAGYARGRRLKNADSRKGVSRKRTVWPGQHIVCGVCGRLYYWGGHGQRDHMMCAGRRDYLCWVGATFDGWLAAGLLCQAVLDHIEALPDFDDTFKEAVRQRCQASRSGIDEELARLTAQLETLDGQTDRAAEAILTMGGSATLTRKLAALEAQSEGLRERLDLLRRCPREDITLPRVSELKRLARDAIEKLAFDSPDFGRRMRVLIPTIRVYPYRLCDGGRVVLRARLILNLASLLGEAASVAGLDELQREELTVDLFEPPEREQFREQVIKLRGDGFSEHRVAAQLDLTVTAAQHAAALQRAMDERGLTDPYVPVTEPPADGEWRRRHNQGRYRFEPLEGYPAW